MVSNVAAKRSVTAFIGIVTLVLGLFVVLARLSEANEAASPSARPSPFQEALRESDNQLGVRGRPAGQDVVRAELGPPKGAAAVIVRDEAQRAVTEALVVRAGRGSVRAVAADHVLGRTGDDGKFMISASVLATLTNGVVVWKQGYLASELPTIRAATYQVTLATAEAFRLKFIDDETGNPIPGVEVVASARSLPPESVTRDVATSTLPGTAATKALYRVWSDKTGSAVIASLPRGFLHYRIHKTGYVASSGWPDLVRLPAPRPFEVRLRKVYGFVVRFRGGGVLWNRCVFPPGLSTSAWPGALLPTNRRWWVARFPGCSVLAGVRQAGSPTATPAHATMDLINSSGQRMEMKIPIVPLCAVAEPADIDLGEAVTTEAASGELRVRLLDPTGKQISVPGINVAFFPFEPAGLIPIQSGKWMKLPIGKYKFVPHGFAKDAVTSTEAIEIGSGARIDRVVRLKFSLVPVRFAFKDEVGVPLRSGDLYVQARGQRRFFQFFGDMQERVTWVPDGPAEIDARPQYCQAKLLPVTFRRATEEQIIEASFWSK